MAFGHPAHDVLIPDFVEDRVGLGGRYLGLANVGRLPDLQRMVFLWVLARLKEDKVPVIKHGEAVTGNWRLHLLVDHVVREENVDSVVGLVKHIQIVFAVGRRDPAFEFQVPQVRLEGLVLARL